MTIDPAVLCPQTLWLEIPTAALDLELRAFSHAGARWNAYLNRLAQTTVLAWIQEDFESGARVWPSVEALANFHEFLNGTAITCGQMRLVCIPTEQVDREEVRIPREWVDIPEWAADYYLPVEVDCERELVGVWGYVSRARLLKCAQRDDADRTYCLAGCDIHPELHTIWTAQQLKVPLQSRPAPLGSLSLTQARNLIERLGRAEVAFPRLEVPFEECWAPLVGHGGWRQRLYEQRVGLPGQWSIGEWLRRGVSELGHSQGWQLRTAQAGGRSSHQMAGRTLVRQMVVAGQPYELRIYPLYEEQEHTWRFELRNLAGRIPGGLKLRLLTEDLQPFTNNEDVAQTAVDELYIDVRLEPGDGLVWEVEPQPLNYDREVLIF
ncbi:DUF1822 family protein [Gloeobacter violaceus]|uniref:Glr0221 protein n=1 Tax=Gloeobacter violaceus (strain ATCC 29082 / PCC 7421) TaxID=251221 RepID=Q7NP37_GLOVI|nr:DUF1822 family protein [Gloeobacter violaceus]BAC88162.1 glr0221 [Gloeobacter violaceus PCC 7421]